MPKSPIKTPSSTRVAHNATSSPAGAASSVVETPSVAPLALLPSVMDLTPPTTLPRRRASDGNAYHPAKRVRTLEESITDEEEGDPDFVASRPAPSMTPTRAALTLATPNTTNILSPVSKRPRLGRCFSTTSVGLDRDDEFVALSTAEATSTEMMHTLSAPVLPSSNPHLQERVTPNGTNQSVTELPAYTAYLARQRREHGDDGNSIWSPDVEEAFMEAIRKIPKVGRRKITVNGRPCGRNELISDFILRKTGKVRTRKQVSSHIQVLKHLLKEDSEFMNLVSDTPSKTTSQRNIPLMFTSPTTAQESEVSSGYTLPKHSTSPLNIRQQLGRIPTVSQHQVAPVMQGAKPSPANGLFSGPTMADRLGHISPSPRLELPTRLDHSSPQSLLFDSSFVEPFLSPPSSQDPNANLAVPHTMMYMNPRFVAQQPPLQRNYQQGVRSYVTDMPQNLGVWIECDPIEPTDVNHANSLYSSNELGIWTHDL
ncbi:TEA/ATTS domain family-domain-containing protein [Lipomyces kononenkoae]|uniref:TEA/ATTS domain family-domain-containing protein n=1 Tax=Lipomyces kononenkoae TaxID=34357 RepID=A0ACC3T753_LIPKO